MKHTLENDLLTENDRLNITLGGKNPEHLDVDPAELRILCGLPDTYTEGTVEWHGGYDYDAVYVRLDDSGDQTLIVFTPFASEEAITAQMTETANARKYTILREYENTENGTQYLLCGHSDINGAPLPRVLYAKNVENSFRLRLSYGQILPDDILFSLTSERLAEE